MILNYRLVGRWYNMIMLNKNKSQKTSELEFCEKIKEKHKKEIKIAQNQYIRLMPAFYPKRMTGDNSITTIHFSVE